MIIAFGTIISSLQSDRLTRRFGTGKVTAVCVGITALALWGFSISHSFLMLCLWAVPYGLGAGSVDISEMPLTHQCVHLCLPQHQSDRKDWIFIITAE